MSEQEQQFSSHDEISLVDLIAVLVRFRRMIVVGVAVVSVLAIAMLWVLPSLGTDTSPAPTYTTQLELAIGSIPSAAQQYLSTELSQLVLAELQDARFVSPIYDRYRRELNAGAREFESDPEYVRYVREEVINGTYRTSWNAETSTISLSCSCENPEAGEAFLRELAASLPAALQPTITRQTENSIEIIRRTLMTVQQLLTSVMSLGSQSLSSANGGQPDPGSLFRYTGTNAQQGIQTLAELIMAEESLRVLSNRLPSFIATSGRPILVDDPSEGQGRSRSVTLVLVIVSALFFFVLAAFVRQYVHNVSRDPAEMAKLKAAWKRRDLDEE